MRTVLVANRNGGVGKTLIAATLASALARRGERAVYAELAADGLSVFDRELSPLEPIKQQWQPIVDFLTA